MALLTQSTEFGTLRQRDVMEAFRMVIAKNPTFLSLIGMSPTMVTHHKHEWLEAKKSPVSWTVNGAVDASATTTIVFDSNSGIKVGDILGFKASTGASLTQKAKITAVDGGGTDVTASWLAANTNDLTDNAVAFLVSRARSEFSTEDLADNATLTEKFNYTQIFRRDFGLSRTTLQSRMYGLSTQGELSADPQANTMSMIGFQLENQMRDIMYELNNSVLFGYKEVRVAGAANGSMGGVLPFLEAESTALYNASAGALSTTILNGALNQAGENGANGSDLTLMMMHPRQARKFAALDSTVTVLRGDTTTGRYIAEYQSDLAGSNGGSRLTLAVDRNFPEDKIAMLDPTLINLAAMENLSVQETTDGKDDGRTFKLLGEMTLEVKNAADGHILIYNLAL